MFVRIKKIHNKEYGYLVENVWTKEGSRQKVKGYLGKILRMGTIDYTQPQVDKANQFFTNSYETILTALGFSCKDGICKKDDICINLLKYTVSDKTRPIVLQLNEGFLCKQTLKQLYEYTSEVKVKSMLDHGKNLPHLLANSLVEAGLIVDEETYITLYGKIVPTS